VSLNSITETLKATESAYKAPAVYVNSFHTIVMFNNNVKSYEDKFPPRNNHGVRQEHKQTIHELQEYSCKIHGVLRAASIRRLVEISNKAE
jgi:hypothetical protein